jgi:DNA repair photolyase
VRWSDQELGAESAAALPGLARLSNLVRTVTTPEFAGMRFHEVLAKSALNKVPGQSAMPFGWTINPYRGCSHACVYCLGAETMILMADGTQRPIWAVRVGDEVVGTRFEGRYRRYVATTVLAHWQTRKPAYLVSLEDGTQLTASAEHRFLTERGWKHVAAEGIQRPHLTTKNALIGFGAAGLSELDRPAMFESEYRRGYLTGMVRGDAHLATHTYRRASGRTGVVYQFRLALVDQDVLARTRLFLNTEGVEVATFEFSHATETRLAMHGIRTASKANFERITELTRWPDQASATWQHGFLAGIFDAEGSHSRGILRISNKNPEILEHIRTALDSIGVRHATDALARNGVSSIRVVGGLQARQRFFRMTQPAITRKLTILGAAVKSNARLGVLSVRSLGRHETMYDMTTGTGDFIANGVVSHNCFARGTHRYLDLDAGRDFDAEVIVKVNVAEVLARELARPAWGRHPVALGTNTDPYQRAEGRYRLMPGVIAALAESGTPFSILTKGTLLRRDLPLIAEAAQRVRVDLAMSIAIFDDELQQSLEPGTPTAKARLDTVRAVRDHGLECSVFLMPVLPYLTDTIEHLDTALRQVKDAGAASVLYTSLHLRPGAREWFLSWLEREHPALVPRYAQVYGSNAYAAKGYREWLAARVRPLLRRYGLDRGSVSPATGGVHSGALRGVGGLIAAELPIAQPTLF